MRGTYNRKLAQAKRGINFRTLRLIERRIQHDIDVTHDILRREYGITRNKAIALITLLKPRISTGVCFGSKFEAYYTEEEALKTPTYSVDDLKGEELEMLLNENKDL